MYIGMNQVTAAGLDAVAELQGGGRCEIVRYLEDHGRFDAVRQPGEARWAGKWDGVQGRLGI
jgi:hypothetical protein